MKKTVKYFFVFILLFVLVVLNIKGWRSNFKNKQEIELLRKELAKKTIRNTKAEDLNAHLQKKMEVAKQDLQPVIEEKAREDFGMIKEGETYFHFEKNESKDE